MDLVGAEIAEANHQDSRGELNAELGPIFEASEESHSEIVRDAIWRNIPADEYPDGMDGTEDLRNLGTDRDPYDAWFNDHENPWAGQLQSRMTEAEQNYFNGLLQAETLIESEGR